MSIRGEIHVHAKGDESRNKAGLISHLIHEHKADPEWAKRKSFSDLRIAHTSDHVEHMIAMQLESEDEAVLLAATQKVLDGLDYEDTMLVEAVTKLRYRLAYRDAGGYLP